jgi:hypothetical protein
MLFHSTVPKCCCCCCCWRRRRRRRRRRRKAYKFWYVNKKDETP